MNLRFGTGPVFAFEWLLRSRRPGLYISRVAFVLLLLAGLSLVWMNEFSGRELDFRSAARVGQSFFFAIAGLQLALVMLAAPAATAGAICQDKARGALAQLLVTDLSAAEIVLGKLAAGLIPVLGLIACTLPVVAICTWMGGIDPIALTGAVVVAVGVAVLSCALALTLSVWGRRPHEVLLATYLILLGWCLLLFVHLIAQGIVGRPTAPDGLLIATNPFTITFFPADPATRRGPNWDLGFRDQLRFCGGCLAAAGVLTGLAIARLRPVTVRDLGRSSPGEPSRRRPRRLALPLAMPFAWILAPLSRRLMPPADLLDVNPVLWREWHRRRPSGWTRFLHGSYLMLAACTLVYALATRLRLHNSLDIAFVTLLNGFLAFVGLLLLSVSSATSLVEERARGSLDVLLSTPIATSHVVWGKWLGSFRGALLQATLPALATFLASAPTPQVIISSILVFGFLLALAAFLVSLGLNLAIRTPRLNRVLGGTICAYIFLCFGTIFATVMLTSGPDFWAYSIISASPIWTTGRLSYEATRSWSTEWSSATFWTVAWTILYGAAAALILHDTLCRFDRSLGRITDPTEPRSLWNTLVLPWRAGQAPQ